MIKFALRNECVLYFWMENMAGLLSHCGRQPSQPLPPSLQAIMVLTHGFKTTLAGLGMWESDLCSLH